MVWSACVVAPVDRRTIADHPNITVLHKTKLPCPFRVRFLLSASGRRKPKHKVQFPEIPVTQFCERELRHQKIKLPKIIPLTAATRSSTIISSVGTELGYMDRKMQENDFKMLSTVRKLQKRHRMRLAIEQIARRQQAIRAPERPTGERAAGFRVKASLADWGRDVENGSLDGIYWQQVGVQTDYDSGSDDDNTYQVWIANSYQVLNEKMWRVDQNARTKLIWSDLLNRWIKVRERGDAHQGHVFWSFVHSKKLSGWETDVSGRFHDCHCKGHNSHHPKDDEICICMTCEERWAAYRRFLKGMRGRMKKLRESDSSKEEMRKAKAEEAKRLREYMAIMAEVDRLKQDVPSPSRSRPKYGSSRQTTKTSSEPFGLDSDDDTVPVLIWNDSSEEELQDLMRGDDDDENRDVDFGERSELDFHDKMYEVNYEEDFDYIPETPSPIQLAIPSPVPSKTEPTPPPVPKTVTPPPPPVPKAKKKVPVPAKPVLKMPRKKPSKKGGKEKKKVDEAGHPPPPPTAQTPKTPASGFTEESIPTPHLRSRTPDTPPPMPSNYSGNIVYLTEEESSRESHRIRHISTEDSFDFQIVEEPCTPPPPTPPKKLQRPPNWGEVSKVAEELQLRPTKSASKRRALEKALKNWQKKVDRGRKQKEAAKEKENELPEFEEEEEIDPDWLQQFYYLQEKAIGSRCRYAFQSADTMELGRLNFDQIMRTLCLVNPHLKENEITYLKMVLEMFGVDLVRGVDVTVFTIIAAFSLRLTALDEWVRTMVNEIDFRLLEYKVEFCKRLWFTCSDDSKRMSEEQFRLLLMAGGVTPAHERSACEKLFSERPEPHFLDFLDFLSYLPLFIAIHMRIAGNPMDDSRTR